MFQMPWEILKSNHERNAVNDWSGTPSFFHGTVIYQSRRHWTPASTAQRRLDADQSNYRLGSYHMQGSPSLFAPRMVTQHLVIPQLEIVMQLELARQKHVTTCSTQ